MNVIIKKVGNECFDAIVNFIKEIDDSFPVPISKKVEIDKYVRKILDNGVCFMAYHKSIPIGVLTGYNNDLKTFKGFISALGVKDGYRGNNIGTKLINEFITCSKAMGMKKVILPVYSKNYKAIKFYEKNGFLEDKDEKSDFVGNIIMSKEISEDFNILFTSSGRRGYLLEYFRKALNGRGMIHASNSSSLVSSFKHADKNVVTPLIYDKDYIPFLLKYCKENNIKLIISLFDIDLPILAKNKDKFLEIGTKVLVSNEEFINICNDKWKSFNYLKENGFNVPKTYIDYSEAEKDLLNGNLKFPVIIKPRWGMGSISIEEAFNMEELKVLYEKAKRKVFSSYLKYESSIDKEESIIIQEKLDGDEYGLDIINDLDGNYQNTIVKKKYSMVSGETYCAKTVNNDKAVAIGEKLSKLSSHIGNLDVDLFLVGDKFYILEMNARFGGGYPFSHIAGVNLPLAIINWYNGIKVDKSLLEAKVGVIAHKDISILDISEYNKN